MIGITVQVTKADEIKAWAKQMPTDFSRRVALLVGSYALRIEREAKRAAPVRANVLRQSIHTLVHSDGKRTTARIGTNVHYAPHLEYGTGTWGPKGQPYEIRPKTKKALAFPVQAATELGTGRALYVKRTRTGKRSAKLTASRRQADRIVRRKVIHPGISPRPFLGPPFERLGPAFKADMEQLAGTFKFPGAQRAGRMAARPSMGGGLGQQRRFRSRFM